MVDREKEKAKRFEDLEVWKKSHELVLKIYNITKDYPSEEKFGLVSQMRRSAVSIPANIAEGFKKRSLKDKSNFFNIAQASLEELKYYLILSKDLENYEYTRTGVINSICHAEQGEASQIYEYLTGFFSRFAPSE